MEKVLSVLQWTKSKRFIGFWTRLRLLVLGKESDKGFIFKLFIYLLLIETAYIYINPILYMISTMFKGLEDLLDPAVYWVPKSLYWGHLKEAWAALKYVQSFSISLIMSSGATLLQVIFCAMAGYAFARLNFPFKKFWYVCLILTFIVPPQVTILPMIILYRELGFIDTYAPMLIPSLFGHGVKGALYVIIYRQFFSVLPKELEEAAKIDGASIYRVFFRVMLPLAMPAIIVVFLFSFVWNWNDSYYPMMYLYKLDQVPLSVSLAKAGFGSATEEDMLLADSLQMAASFLAIMPPLILYIFTQRWFVEGVERTGLVE